MFCFRFERCGVLCLLGGPDVLTLPICQASRPGSGSSGVLSSPATLFQSAALWVHAAPTRPPAYKPTNPCICSHPVYQPEGQVWKLGKFPCYDPKKVGGLGICRWQPGHCCTCLQPTRNGRLPANSLQRQQPAPPALPPMHHLWRSL